MRHKLAIDFGTTNTVMARWNHEKDNAEIVNVDGKSKRDDLPPDGSVMRLAEDGELEEMLTDDDEHFY